MTGDATKREEQALHDVVERLTSSFAAAYSGAQVAEAVETIHHRFDDRPVRDFVPVLVERFAREELRSRLSN